MALSFAVSDVTPPRQPRMKPLDRQGAIQTLLRGGIRPAAASFRGPPLRKVEALSPSDAALVCANDASALAQAAHDAFYQHYPLVLTPDAVWFCLAQGFAQHVNLHADELRKRFVRHEGKLKLLVERPDFFLGQPNPWPEAFAAFSGQIASHVGRLRDLIVADFSTTGPVERAASEVLVMDAFQAYFDYEMLCGCGIPEISLLGTVDDWKSVRQRASMFSEFGLEAWTDALLPVLDEVVRTAEGKVDQDFWRSFFRYQSGSGPSVLTGWILTLFPYLKSLDDSEPSLEFNPFLKGWEQALRKSAQTRGWVSQQDGPPLRALPGSIASAPVRLVDARDGSSHDLRFVAGLFGVTQDDAGALAPEFGWAVVHDSDAG